MQKSKCKMQNLIKNILSGIGLFVLVIISSLAIGPWVLPAQAISDVTPAKAVMNPVTQTLYVVDNSTPKIKIYEKKSYGTWEASNSYINLPAGSACYGLAVNSDGTKLYISINAGANSKIWVYNLNSGIPTGSPDDMTAYWSSSSSPAGMALAPGKLYVADKGIGRFRVFNTETNSFETNITDHLAGKSNLYDIAVTPPLIVSRGGWPPRFSTTYKIYVSQKTETGAIYVFNYNNGTISYESTITGLTYPTYLKVVGDATTSKLYVAVNGTDGVDIKVYNTTDNSLIGNVRSGIVGSYGWTAFDVDLDGNWLVFKKAKNSLETLNGFYKIKTSDISGTVTATEVTGITINKSDGVIISHDKCKAALTNSTNGSLQVINTSIINHDANTPSNLKQYKLDGSTEIPPGGTTNENKIIVKFTVTDPDGDQVTPTVYYRRLGTSAWNYIPGSPVSSGSTVTMTIPASGGLADGSYEWGVKAKDPAGVSEPSADYNGPGSADFIVNTSAMDTTPPAAITDLRAAVGTNAGEIRLNWTAVGDDGNTGTASSYIVKYSYSGPITTEALFNAATTYAQSWVPKAAGQAESYVLTGLNPGEQIWVSIKAQDEVPNTGALGNCAATIVKNYVPAPIITKVYPQRGPNDRINHIVIIGENLYNDMTATIGTIPLLNVHQDSPTMVQADVPAGITPETYEITITCPGGTYDDATHTNPNNDFTVFDPSTNPDTQAPAIVTNFSASDGEDGKSTLTWTNPTDTDLREVIVRRKEGAYPANHSDGIQVYQTMIPEPGATINYVDNGLTNGTTYYYAVFSRDTSDNWNDTVTPGSNADTGTPGGGGPTSSEVTIDLTYSSERGNIFWISIPYINTYGTASGLLAAINTQNGLPADSANLITSIGRWNGTANPQVYESYDYLGILGWQGTDFNLVTGEAVYLSIASNTRFTLRGNHDPSFAFNLPYVDGRTNIFWISLPYSGDYTTASSIVADINNSAGLSVDSGELVTSVGRWNGDSQVYESYDYLGILGWQGTDFTFQPGEGYYISITSNLNNWRPKTK